GWDGTWRAPGGADGKVRLWDVATGRERATLTGHTDGAFAVSVHAVAIGPNDNWLAAAFGHTFRVRDRTFRMRNLRMWDLTDRKPRLFREEEVPGHAVIAPDGRWLVDRQGN